jgi:hypothetical protein
MEQEVQEHEAFISSLCPLFTETFEQFEVVKEPSNNQEVVAVLAPIPPASFPVTAKEAGAAQGEQSAKDAESEVPKAAPNKCEPTG